MPSSLRWLAALFVASVITAIVAGGAMYGEARSRTRIMAEQITGGSVDAGRVAIGAYGCGACHSIPGIRGANGAVGPALGRIATRAEIAGRLPNTPAAMTRWLRQPQSVVPGNGMPDQGITASDARDIAAYLYELK